MEEGKKEREITKMQKEAFLKHFAALRYNLSKTAKKVGIHRNTVANWRSTDKVFKLRYSELLEEKIDNSEERLYLVGMGIPEIEDNTLVGWKVKPNVRALEIHLKAVAKDRGYGDHVVIDDQREETNHEAKTNEELMAEMELIKERYSNEESGDE